MPGNDHPSRPYRIVVGHDAAHDTGYGDPSPAQDWAVTIGLTRRGIPEAMVYAEGGSLCDEEPMAVRGVNRMLGAVADALLAAGPRSTPDSAVVLGDGQPYALPLLPCGRIVPPLADAFPGHDIKVLRVGFPPVPLQEIPPHVPGQRPPPRRRTRPRRHSG